MAAVTRHSRERETHWESSFIWCQAFFYPVTAFTVRTGVSIFYYLCCWQLSFLYYMRHYFPFLKHLGFAFEVFKSPLQMLLQRWVGRGWMAFSAFECRKRSGNQRFDTWAFKAPRDNKRVAKKPQSSVTELQGDQSKRLYRYLIFQHRQTSKRRRSSLLYRRVFIITILLLSHQKH